MYMATLTAQQVWTTAPGIDYLQLQSKGGGGGIVGGIDATGAGYGSLSGSGGGGVTSLNTLTGAVVLSAGVNITLTPAGNTITISSAGGGAVSSVFGRSGAVVAANNDYSFSQISGTLTTAQEPATTVNSIVNDTNVTGSIAAQALTLGWTGTLSKARSLATVVYTDQINTYGTFLQDFTSSTLKVPNSAALAPTVNALIAYDTTANRFNGGLNGANVIFPWFITGTPVNGQAAVWSSGNGLLSSAAILTNPMTTLGDIIDGGAAGVPTRLAGPTTPNGVPQILTSTPSGGVAAAPVWQLSGVTPNPQTGTTYTYVATDRAGYTTFSNAAAVAVTLPQAGSAGFASNFVNISCNIGAGTATITPTTSTISYSNGSTYTSGAANLPLTTGQCAWIYSDNTNYFAIVRSGGGAGSSALSAITLATASNTIANGNNPQTWNWAQTTDAQDGMSFGETSAATNGTLTNGLANQAVVSISTASASTSTPLEVAQGSVTGTVAFPALQIETTWNNASLVGEGLIFNATDTASNAASLLFDFRKGNTTQIKGDKSGNLTTLTSLQVTASAPGVTAGTAGAWAATEGTAFTNVAGTAGIYPDSTAHELKVATNGASTFGQLVRSQPSPISLTGQVAAITTATLCAAAAGACNVAGMYRATFYLDSSVTCATPGPAAVAVSITFTDEVGTKSAQTVPLDVTGATSLSGTLPLGNTTGNATGTTSFWSTGASAIQYATTYTACTTGTGTYSIRAAVERLF
jgi:hypothetical protein